jgi:polyhydroxybutyrate depolymerase
MLHRKVAIGRALALLAVGVGVVSFVGCSGGGSGSTNAGAAGATSTAGGAGSVGSAGSAGSSGSAGASSSGSAGSGDAGAAPSGTAGSDDGSAGAVGGSAGSAGAAGAGAGGATTSAPDGGGAASAGASGRPSGPSAGCNLDAPTDPIGKPTMHTMTVNVAPAYASSYTNRKYFTTLPMTFDPKKPYPVVFWGPGCGATGSEGSSFTTGHFLTDILYVQLLSVTGCFQAGKQGTADSPDGPYFDQVLSEIEAKYCIDKGKLYAAGTSSGAWLSNYLACARGNVLRGTAADSGGLQQAHGTCTGGAAVMEMPGDSTTTIENGVDIGSGPARDLFIKLNGCSMTPTTMTFGKANNCQVYGGCDSPVVWCNVGGAHQSGNQVIAESAWAFWNTLK